MSYQELCGDVHQALLSGDEQTIATATDRLRSFLRELPGQIDAGVLTAAELERLRDDCRRLTLLSDSAAAFYSGLASAMRIQLQGYGSTPLSAEDQAASRFAVQG